MGDKALSFWRNCSQLLVSFWNVLELLPIWATPLKDIRWSHFLHLWSLMLFLFLLLSMTWLWEDASSLSLSSLHSLPQIVQGQFRLKTFSHRWCNLTPLSLTDCIHQAPSIFEHPLHHRFIDSYRYLFICLPFSTPLHPCRRRQLRQLTLSQSLGASIAISLDLCCTHHETSVALHAYLIKVDMLFQGPQATVWTFKSLKYLSILDLAILGGKMILYLHSGPILERHIETVHQI